MDGGKIRWRLSEVNARAVSRGQDELVGKFKMVVGDVILIMILVFKNAKSILLLSI